MGAASRVGRTTQHFSNVGPPPAPNLRDRVTEMDWGLPARPIVDWFNGVGSDSLLRSGLLDLGMATRLVLSAITGTLRYPAPGEFVESVVLGIGLRTDPRGPFT